MYACSCSVLFCANNILTAHNRASYYRYNSAQLIAVVDLVMRRLTMNRLLLLLLLWWYIFYFISTDFSTFLVYGAALSVENICEKSEMLSTGTPLCVLCIRYENFVCTLPCNLITLTREMRTIDAGKHCSKFEKTKT